MSKEVIMGATRYRDGEPFVNTVVLPGSKGGRSVSSPSPTVGSYWRSGGGVIYKLVDTSEAQISFAGVSGFLIVERVDDDARSKIPTSQFLGEFSRITLMGDIEKQTGVK